MKLLLQLFKMKSLNKNSQNKRLFIDSFDYVFFSYKVFSDKNKIPLKSLFLNVAD